MTLTEIKTRVQREIDIMSETAAAFPDYNSRTLRQHIGHARCDARRVAMANVMKWLIEAEFKA